MKRRSGPIPSRALILFICCSRSFNKFCTACLRASVTYPSRESQELLSKLFPQILILFFYIATTHKHLIPHLSLRLKLGSEFSDFIPER